MDTFGVATGKRLNFWALWTSTASSNLADGLFKLALPVLASRLTASPILIAGVSFAITLPWPLFALHAGALADRLDRRKTMARVNMVRVLALGILTIASIINMVSLPMIYLTALVLGFAETMADTAAMSLPQMVVPRSELERANARLTAAQTLMNEFIGPPLGGALAALGLGLALGSSSGLYIISVVALLVMRGSFRPARTSTANINAEIAEGVRFLLNNRLLYTLTIILAVMMACWSAYLSIIVVYAVAPGPLGLNEWEYGMMLMALGVGGLIGTLITRPVQGWLGRRWLIFADIAGTCLMLAVPALIPNVWAVALAALIGGTGGTMWNITVASLRQHIVPDALLGRVSGAMKLISWGMMPIGAGLAGLIAELVNVRAVFALGGVAAALLLFPFFLVITEERLNEAIGSGQRQATPDQPGQSADGVIVSH